MKKQTIVTTIALTLISFWGFTQSNQATGFQNGSIIGINGEKTAGTIKLMFKQRGGIFFRNTSGAKEQFSPNEIQSFEVNAEQYTTYSGDFYKVIISGKKINLLQKVTDNSGQIFYNGSQAISNISTEGKTGDLYLQSIGGGSFWHVTEQNYLIVAEMAFESCSDILAEVKAKQSKYSELASTVAKANNCK